MKGDTMKTVTFSIRMPRDLYDRLTAAADSDDRSLNYTVRRLVASGLDATGTRPAETASGFVVGQEQTAPHASRLASEH